VDMLMNDHLHHNNHNHHQHPPAVAASTSALQQQQHQQLQQHYDTGKPANHHHAAYDDGAAAATAPQVRYLGANEHPSRSSMVASEPVAMYDGKSTTHLCSSKLAAMHLNNNHGETGDDLLHSHLDAGPVSDIDVELKPLPMYHPEFASSGVVAQR
jgi:hypothetical protein